MTPRLKFIGQPDIEASFEASRLAARELYDVSKREWLRETIRSQRLYRALLEKPHGYTPDMPAEMEGREMDLMHEEPEPTPEARDHEARRKVAIWLIVGWSVAILAIVAAGA